MISRYILPMEIFGPNQGVMLFNTLTRSYLPLDTKVWRICKEGHFEHLHPDLLGKLKQTGIIVEDNFDEKAEYIRKMNEIQMGLTSIGMTILTTYACNCRCKYCFESDIHSSIFMDHTTIGKTLAWIEETIRTIPSVESMDICYHGGEPLLDTKIISEFSGGIRCIAEKTKVFLHQSIVTNATLLNERVSDELVDAGIESLMVTMDGPSNVHDARRPFSDGSPTFDITIKNLTSAAPKFRTYFSMNIDKQNASDAVQLLRILKDLGMSSSMQVSFGLVKPGMDSNSHCASFSMADEEGAKCMEHLFESAIMMGFDVGEILGFGMCTRKRLFSFVIDPYGRLYDCITGVSRDDFFIGTVDLPPRKTVEMRKGRLPSLWDADPKCANCSFWPLCLGGCGEQALVKSGDIDKRDCNKLYLKNWIPAVARLKMLQEVRSKMMRFN